MYMGYGFAGRLADHGAHYAIWLLIVLKSRRLSDLVMNKGENEEDRDDKGAENGKGRKNEDNGGDGVTVK
jgi:hypothetical protein